MSAADRLEQLERVLAGAGVGVWQWRRARGPLTLSMKAREICGFRDRGPVTLRMAAAIIHRRDRSRVFNQIRGPAEATQAGDVALELQIVTPAGERKRIALSGQAVFETVDGVTTATHVTGVLRDVTAEHLAQAGREREATRVRLALGAAHVAVWQSDQGSGQVYGPEFNEILGFPDDRVLTADEVRRRYLPGELERIRDITNAAFARGERRAEVEARFRRLDGKVRWLLLRGELSPNAEGQPRGFVGVAMDVTERKEAEERMKLLALEVDHRANNLLAVVQSIVQLSTGSTPEALKRVLLGRIAALGRAHQLLSEARWHGADLRRLVEEELLAFTPGDARQSIRGEDVALSPPAAQAVAMALHELATNATKYGALSAPAGRVDISWSREGSGAMTIHWLESGGPPVTPPIRQGLGVAVLARALAGMKGETRLDWRPGGLFCEMTLPAEAVETDRD